ncbi:MAG: caspase family protein [Myxococcota bacterium]|nr:caspase family protein [Myxococcota bacterium]
MNDLQAWARAALPLGTALIMAACASPPPTPAPLPDMGSLVPSEPLPIDGLWKTRSDPEVYARLERGRFYLQRGFVQGAQQGTLLYGEIHQVSAREYSCRSPQQRDGGIVWPACTITLEEDGSLRVRIPQPESDAQPIEQRFVLEALDDAVWFAVQSRSRQVVSVREAHEPPPPDPTLEPAETLELPPTPEPKKVAPATRATMTRFGRYRALVIGSAEYTYLPSVATAEGDAAAVSDLLADRYGFRVALLRNPSLGDLSKALARLERELRSRDNLLIYWAGHGFVNDEVGRCYWFPVEALGDDLSQGLASDDLAAALRRMKAKHVLIVADSCFTASERREVELQQEEGTDVQERLSELRTRVVLSSGGLEPIQDGQGSGHSTFTGAFLSALSANGEVIDGQSLFAQIEQIVTAAASQKPEYGNIIGADHDGGDFLFVPTP